MNTLNTMTALICLQVIAGYFVAAQVMGPIRHPERPEAHHSRNLRTTYQSSQSDYYEDEKGVYCPTASGVRWNEILRNHNISSDWILDIKDEPYYPRPYGYGYYGIALPATQRQKVYTVKSFPIAEGKTAENYGPSRQTYDITIDTVILSQIGAQNAKRTGEILENWKNDGLSSHYFVTKYYIVAWINPKFAIGQMAGQWNSRALEILVLTDQKQAVSEEQIYLLKHIIDSESPSQAYNIDIKVLLSHSEARGSGQEGVVSNINYVRRKLCLPLPGNITIASPSPARVSEH